MKQTFGWLGDDLKSRAQGLEAKLRAVSFGDDSSLSSGSRADPAVEVSSDSRVADFSGLTGALNAGSKSSGGSSGMPSRPRSSSMSHQLFPNMIEVRFDGRLYLQRGRDCVLVAN